MRTTSQLAEESLPGTPAQCEPRRLLFVITSSDFGGTETFLRELVLRLDRREFAPIVCSLRPLGRVADDIAAAGIPVLTSTMSDEPRLPQLARGIISLARWIDEYRIDLVQSFLYRANTLAGLAGRLARRRPVVVAGQRSLYPLGGRRAALAARWTRGLACQVVAVSAAVRQQLIDAEGFAPERVVVIENGVDTDRYNVGTANADRHAFGLQPDAIAVGGVGRLSPEKGFHHLLEAVARTRASGLPVTLLLAGDGPERSRLEQQAQVLGVDGAVKFLGRCADLRPLYAAIDIFALPSLEEGSPNALLEAMACGCAVAASRVGGVPEIVGDERSGLLVEPGSPGALAECLTRLGTAPELRRRLGKEARRRVTERFDVCRMVERHAELYRQLLSS